MSWLTVRNKALAQQISNPNDPKYVDLRSYFFAFDYPLSLSTADHIGRIAYQRGHLDVLELFALIANKVFNNLTSEDNARSLGLFLLRERDTAVQKSRELIGAIKKYAIDGTRGDLEEAITKFSAGTYYVRLPVASFIMRMLLPGHFATIDVRALNALRAIGFEGIKKLPAESPDKGEYLAAFSAGDYLDYNGLLADLGNQYLMPGGGTTRHMWPSEVDMALYTFDKLGGGTVPCQKHEMAEASVTESKAKRIMAVVEEVYNDVIKLAGEPWAQKSGIGPRMRGAAIELRGNMLQLAQKDNHGEMYRYYYNALASENGKLIGQVLQERGRKSLESERERVDSIYSDP